MPSDDRKRDRKRSRDRSRDRDRDRKRDRKDDRKRDDRRDDRRRDDRRRSRSRDRSRKDDRKPYDGHDRRGGGHDDRRRRDDDDPRKGKEPTPPSLVPRAKTPPEGGTGGFFVRGGVQTSTMKKSDNVDDHVFMPGEKIGDAFHLSAEEKKPVVEPDNDGVEGFDRDMRDAKRAANADDYQVKMLQAAHKYNRTEENMEVKMVAARIQNGYKPGGGIRANEIKGFLNIWCNQRRLKPEYDFIERGKPPKGTFICKLKIEGFNYIADCEARTKREAQADAAWDFANKLVELGYCNKNDLPNKTMATVNNQGCVPTEWKSVLSDEMIDAAGQWTPDNCRKRLSMFCNYEKISCEILNTAIGPDHAKIAIAELKLTLRKYGKEFYAKEQARTKKLANSLVAWSIMKQLYQADMMEGFGERMKRAADSKFLAKKDIEPGYAVGNDIATDLSMDATTGDWTLDSSRTRLHEYFLHRGIEVEYDMLEIGFPPDRVYQAQLEFEIDGKRYHSFYECDNKKMTQKKTAFDIVVKLYHDNKIEPNTGRRNWGDGPSGNVLGGAMQPTHPPYLNPNCTPRERDEFYVKGKLDTITPHPNYANTVNSTLIMIEERLKAISDEMFEAQRVLPGRAELPDDDNRELMGVMRVGALAANTVLSGECEFMMVMMMKEKPTYQMLARIAKGLSDKMPHEENYNFNVVANYRQGGIEIMRERLPQMVVLVKMTSTKWREEDAQLLVEDPTPEPNNQNNSPKSKKKRKNKNEAKKEENSEDGVKTEAGGDSESKPEGETKPEDKPEGETEGVKKEEAEVKIEPMETDTEKPAEGGEGKTEEAKPEGKTTDTPEGENESEAKVASESPVTEEAPAKETSEEKTEDKNNEVKDDGILEKTDEKTETDKTEEKPEDQQKPSEAQKNESSEELKNTSEETSETAKLSEEAHPSEESKPEGTSGEIEESSKPIEEDSKPAEDKVASEKATEETPIAAVEALKQTEVSTTPSEEANVNSKPAEEVSEEIPKSREAEIVAEMDAKTAPSTSTLKFPKDDVEEVEEGEIKMIEGPEDGQEDESIKSEGANSESQNGKWDKKIDLKEEDQIEGKLLASELNPPTEVIQPSQPDKLISESQCLNALAELRHSKWFASCAQGMISGVPLIRLVREMCQRVRTWSVLSDWQINLLCQKSLESAQMPLLPSDGIRRVISTLAGGVLLPGGLGIKDPCEKDNTDAFASLTLQDREDITASAQHALRLLSFGVMHKIMGMQPPQ